MNELRVAGERFLAAFDTRDFAQVQACFHPRVQYRALIPWESAKLRTRPRQPPTCASGLAAPIIWRS